LQLQTQLQPSAMPNTSLTKKFTRDSLKRANNKVVSQGGGGGGNATEDDKNKAQIIQTEMARARAKSLRTTNALHRATHRMNAAAAQQQQQQQNGLSPYRSFGLHHGSGATTTPLSAHADRDRDDSNTNHYNAEIINTMSSLTEPTWAAPSMSMDIASTFGGGNSTHQRNPYNNNTLSSSRMQQQHQQETLHEDEDSYDADEGEDPATMPTQDAKHGNKSQVVYEQQHRQHETSRNLLHATASTNEGRDPPPPSTTETPAAVPKKSKSTTTTTTTTTRRKKTKDSSSSSKRRSSSTSSRRSTFSVPVDPRQFETSSVTGGGSSKRSSHRSKSRKEEDRRRSSSSQRSSSVPPVSAAHLRNSSRSRSGSNKSSSNGEFDSHDEQVAAAMAKFRMYEESQKIHGGSGSIGTTSLVTTPTDEKSPGSTDGTEQLRDAILSTSSTATHEHPQEEENHPTVTPSPTNIIAAGATTATVTPRSAVEAARLSLRPSIRRTSSNRSMSSVHSESFSMASSARMTTTAAASFSSSSNSAASNLRMIDAVSAAAAATAAAKQQHQQQQQVQRSSSSLVHSTTPLTSGAGAAAVAGLHRRSLAATTSRTQKMMQDTRARAIHKEKSRFHQSLISKPKIVPEPDAPTTKIKEPLITTPAAAAAGAPQPFDERPPTRLPFGKSVDSSSSNSSSSSHTLISTLFWVIKAILWTLPQFLWRLCTKSGRWEARHKSILITGASSSMGREIARQYAMDGAKLALIAPNVDEESLVELQDQCRELGACQVCIYAADLTNSTSAQLAIQQASKDIGGPSGHLDVVVVHGPTYRQGCYFEEIQASDEIGYMLKENALSGMLALHHALPYIPKSSSSRIVVVSSRAGVLASPYQSVLCASQHALTGFVNALRMELIQSYQSQAPKVCLVSFGELAVGGREDPLLTMGATLPPSKTYSWSGMPLQHAVHDLLDAVAKGRCREFGNPAFVQRWRCLSVLAPSLVDWCIHRHVQSTHYRPLDEGSLEGGGGGGGVSLRRLGLRNSSNRHPASFLKGGLAGSGSCSSKPVCNKSWT
jgi:short-subunit dehydrogenase